jgi:hypothetical protein
MTAMDQPRPAAALSREPIRTISREDLQRKLERGDDFKLVMALNRWAHYAKPIPGSLHFDTTDELYAAIKPGDEVAQSQFERIRAGTYEGHDIDIDTLNSAMLEGRAGLRPVGVVRGLDRVAAGPGTLGPGFHHGGASQLRGAPGAPQYAATIASISTRGWPDVPLTTIEILRLTAVDQLRENSTRRQEVVVAYVLTVLVNTPFTYTLTEPRLGPTQPTRA